MIAESLLIVAGAGTLVSIIGSIFAIIMDRVFATRLRQRDNAKRKPVSLKVELSDGTVLNIDTLNDEQAEAIAKNIENMQRKSEN